MDLLFLKNKLSSQMTMTSSFIFNMKNKIKGSSLSDDDLRYIKEIHDYFTLKDIDDKDFTFERVGSKHDGGYVMIKPFSRCKIAYSIGICDNVDWDSEMVNNGYEVYMYDHTIDQLPFDKNGFHWFRIGICGELVGENLEPLEVMLCNNGHAKQTGMVLKMDVEGCEWDVIDDLSLETLEQFDQIALELHFLHTGNNRDQIRRCLNKLSSTHELVHIHANNSCKALFFETSYRKKHIMPDILEVTYVKKDYCRLKPMTGLLPRNQDSVSTIRLPEMKLGKWNT